MELIINADSWNQICRDIQTENYPPHMNPVIVYNRESGIFTWDSQINPMNENEYIIGRLENAVQWFDGPAGDWSEHDIWYFIMPIVRDIDESNED